MDAQDFYEEATKPVYDLEVAAADLRELLDNTAESQVKHSQYQSVHEAWTAIESAIELLMSTEES